MDPTYKERLPSKCFLARYFQWLALRPHGRRDHAATYNRQDACKVEDMRYGVCEITQGNSHDLVHTLPIAYQAMPWPIDSHSHIHTVRCQAIAEPLDPSSQEFIQFHPICLEHKAQCVNHEVYAMSNGSRTKCHIEAYNIEQVYIKKDKLN